MKFKILVILLCMCNLAFGVAFGDIDSATDAKMKSALKTLQDNSTNSDVRLQKVFAIFDELFDFEQMAKNCLGKTQWNMLSNEQQTEFIDKFVQRLKESYADKLKLYTNQKIELQKSVQTSASRVQLPMRLIDSDGEKYDILYKFFDTKKEKGWLIYDVDILGVSITQTYRSQLDGVLKSGSFEDLITKIESVNLDEKVAK